MDMMLRSESAPPVQMQPAPGAGAQPGARAMVASLKVTAYLPNGGVKQESLRDRWDGTPLPLVWKANRIGDAWQWSDGRAAELRIFTGTPDEVLVGDWATAHGAVKVVVHVTDRVVELDPLDVADVRGTERAKFSEQSWKLGETLPDEKVGKGGAEPITPSTPLAGDSSFGTRPMFRPPPEPDELDGDGATEYVELEIVKIEQNWSRLTSWEQMTDVEKTIAMQQAREAVAERAYREVVAGLDNRIADLEGNLQSLGTIAGAEGVGDDLVKQAVEHSEIELDAMRKARRALDDFEMPRAGKDAPYSPRRMREDIEAEYPGGVESSSVPHVRNKETPRTGGRTRSDKNAKLASQPHPDTGIVFDDRGFPIFDDVAAFDTYIDAGAVAAKSQRAHMVAATTQLDEAIKNGQVSARKFSEEQLKAIKAHLPEIPDYTWHHHQLRGRMQLVPTALHEKTGHVGGFKEWYQ